MESVEPYRLVFPEDKPLIGDCLYLAFEQMKPCNFMETDRVGCYKDRVLGFPGLACTHCVGHDDGFGLRRFFPSTESSLSQTTTSRCILNHVQNCLHCPTEIRDKLKQISLSTEGGADGKSAGSKPKKGGRKRFFHRLWCRIQGLDIDQEETIVIPRTQSQPFGLILKKRRGMCFVKELKAGSAAAVAAESSAFWAGVQVGDRISKVNDNSVDGMSLIQIADLIRQTKETENLILKIHRTEAARPRPREIPNTNIKCIIKRKRKRTELNESSQDGPKEKLDANSKRQKKCTELNESAGSCKLKRQKAKECLELKEIVPPLVLSHLMSIGIDSCEELVLTDHRRLVTKLYSWAKAEDNALNQGRKAWMGTITSWLLEMNRKRYLKDKKQSPKRPTSSEDEELEDQSFTKKHPESGEDGPSRIDAAACSEISMESTTKDHTLSNKEKRHDGNGESSLPAVADNISNNPTKPVTNPDADLPPIDNAFDLGKADPQWMKKFWAYARHKRKVFLGGYNQQLMIVDDKMNKWIEYQRRTRRRNYHRLDRHKYQKLKSLHFVWYLRQKPPPSASEEWRRYFMELQKYRDERGDTSAPNTIELGMWASMQRMKYMSRTLQPELVEALTNIGFQWEDFQADWNRMYSNLTAYKIQYGDCFVPLPELDPEKDEDNEYAELLLWSHRQRLEYELYAQKGTTAAARAQPHSTLSSKEVSLMDSLGFNWKTEIDARWFKKYRLLQAHKKEHGSFDNLGSNEPLGRFVYLLRSQRHVKVKRKRSIMKRAEQESLLDAIGFEWEVAIPETHSWEERYEWLREFRQEHGHCLVPQTHPKLGQWVKNQRKAFDFFTNGKDMKSWKVTLTEDRIAKLNELDFVWRVRGKRGLGLQKVRPNIEKRSSSLCGLVATSEVDDVNDSDWVQGNSGEEVEEEKQDQFTE